MTRLFTAELHRLYARRATRWLVTAGVLAVVAMAVIGWRTTRPPTAEQLHGNQVAYEQAVAEYEAHKVQLVRDCEAGNKWSAKDGIPPADCTDLAPRAESYAATPRQISDVTGILPFGVGLGVGLLGVLGAASSVGAEFSSGSLAAWLLVEPRRSRVYLTKLAAVAVHTAALYVVGIALTLVAWWVVGTGNDYDMALSGWQQEVFAAQSARMLLATVAGAVATAALAFLLRNTAAAFVVVAVWMVGSSWLLLDSRWGAASLGAQLYAWTVGRHQWTWTQCGQTGCTSGTSVLTMTEAGAGLFGLSCLVTLAGWALFRRRDVH